MRLGVFDHLDRGGAPLSTYYEDRLRLVERYDAADIYAYHAAEHHGTPLGMAPSPGLFLAALAQRTRRLRFGPMVYCLPLYHPMRLLEEVCMLDQMSGGRFQLGVGRGISPVEASFYGVDPDETQARYREALNFILAGLRGGDFTFEGTYYRTKDVPMVLEPAQKPHPPLWYGTSSPEAAEWAAENRVNLISNQPPDRVRAITDAYRAAWAQAGNAAAALPCIGMAVHLVVAPTDDKAMKIARRGYAAWRASFMYLWNRSGRPPMTVSYPERFDDLASQGLGIAGGPAKVGDHIGELIERTGINYFVARLAFGDVSYAESVQSLDLLTDQVMPMLETATSPEAVN